jgi:RNA polymerase sigma factor for flagellar operon FliA
MSDAEPKTAATVTRQQAAKAYGKTTQSKTMPAEVPADIETAIREHSDTVRRHARRYARMSGGAVEADDLISVGVIGLMDAFHRFDPSLERPFRVYAEYRIRGAILDELRRLDPMSQPRRREARKFETNVRDLSTELGRTPTEEELADALDVPIDEIHRRRQLAQGIHFVPIENSERAALQVIIQGMAMERPALKILVRQALELLPEREQKILTLYYFHDLNMKEIGKILDLTEARISQLHKEAVKSLREIIEAEATADP